MLVDVFSGLRIPAHVTTREFFALLREKMAPSGVVVMNVVAAPDSELVGSLAATVEAAGFEAAVFSGQREGVRAGVSANVVIVGQLGPSGESAGCLAEVEKTLSMRPISEFEALSAPDGRVLTDAFAPADTLGR